MQNETNTGYDTEDIIYVHVNSENDVSELEIVLAEDSSQQVVTNEQTVVTETAANVIEECVADTPPDPLEIVVVDGVQEEMETTVECVSRLVI